jgi:L-amino acid N-acyltransferase YncA
MGLLSAIGRLLGGNVDKLERQHHAQQVELLHYPADFNFGGERVTIRPLEQGDREAILTFARSLPEHDLLFMRRDITKAENVDAWLHDVAIGTYSSLVAAVGTEIVGYATVASDGMTWTRHVAEMRLQVAPRMRGHGLGRLLTEQAFAIARERGVRKMIAQMTTDQVAAAKSFGRMGFEREAVLRGQVIDRDGALHDLQIMSLDVEAFRAKLDIARQQAQFPTWPTA